MSLIHWFQAHMLELYRLNDKHRVMKAITDRLQEEGLVVAPEEQNWTREWGKFCAIQECCASRFADAFFPDNAMLVEACKLGLPMMPKILLAMPGPGLSWQDHERRKEVWRALTAAHVRQGWEDFPLPPLRVVRPGELIYNEVGQRHQLVCRGRFSLVAEMWIHTVPGRRSDEKDIRRVWDPWKR